MSTQDLEMTNDMGVSRSDDRLVIKILDSSSAINEIIVCKTKNKVKLENKDYYKYQLVKPKGFENEEIFHRLDRGFEALLSVVFTVLAESTRREHHMNSGT